MHNEVSLIVLPSQTKSFTSGLLSRSFVKKFHIVSIWSRFFFGISENHIRDRFSISFAKATASRSEGRWNLRF